MLLYMSNAAETEIYDDLFKSGKVHFAYQMQNFNYNIISGLSNFENIVALSALPYIRTQKAKKIDKIKDNIHFIAIKNSIGKMHKPMNFFRLYREGCKAIKSTKPRAIICDAIAKSPCVVSKILGKKFKIPVIALVTDLPGLLGNKADVEFGLDRMKGFDGYVFLTEQMNGVVNELNRPYTIMEGLAQYKKDLPEINEKERVIIYAGSLWKNNAGIEYFIDGFLKAKMEGYELHLYGKGELVPWIEQVSAENPSVRYMGCVPNDQVVLAQRKASLVVNPRPSNEEFCKYSFPSKTIEYMLSGTPVLMTKLPGVPSEYFNYVYTIDEETGEGAKDALLKIYGLTDAEKREFSRRAKEFIINNKNVKKQCERIFELINKTIESELRVD